MAQLFLRWWADVQDLYVEIYRGQSSKKPCTKFSIPVTYYFQLTAVAYGASAKGEAETDNGSVNLLSR